MSASTDERLPRLRRWPDLVFALMVPGNLAMIAWVVVVANHAGGWDAVGLIMSATPTVFVLLLISTLQAARAVPPGHGLLVTPGQAWLQIGLWASLGAGGAGLTLTTMDGEEASVILTLFPGAVRASEAAAWIGGITSLTLYPILLISLRRRRLASAHERRAAIQRLNRGGAPRP